MFTKRESGLGIFYGGSSVPGKNTVENEDQVVLHIGKESVLVKDVKILGVSNYAGKVYGFEPSFSTEIEDIKLNDEVMFEEKHIVSCSPKQA